MEDDFDDAKADAECDRGFQDGANYAGEIRTALVAKMRELRGDTDYEDYYNDAFFDGFYDAL